MPTGEKLRYEYTRNYSSFVRLIWLLSHGTADDSMIPKAPSNVEGAAPFYVVESSRTISHMQFAAGDYVKFEIKDEQSGQSEWMWLRVDRCDALNRLVFGWLDSEPVAFTTDLKLGQHMAVSYDNVREHKKPSEF